MLLGVKVQVASYQLGGSDSEQLCNALNISIRKNWTCRFAAIGALKAVCYRKDLLVKLFKYLIKVFGRLLLEPLEVFFVFLVGIIGFFHGVGQTYGQKQTSQVCWAYLRGLV
jgi:hypothetical protein